MSVSDDLHRPRVFGSMVVSPKGQVVIPANARKELSIDSGDTLLACGTPHGGGLLLVKADAIEQMLSMMSEHLTGFGKIVKEHKSPRATGNKKRS